MQLTFRMMWLDTRLAYSNLVSEGKKAQIPYLTLDKTSPTVWFPDLFFANEINAHYQHLLTPNAYTRIFPNGDVLYSTR